MIVAGWADGYTNIALRAYEAMTCPRRVIIGPWAHASTATSIPGPHIDLVPELIRWFSRWLRDERNGIDEEPPIAIFVRRSTRPAPDLAEMRGEWRSEPTWPAERLRPRVWRPEGDDDGSDLRARRRRHRGVDLLRGQAAVDASGRPALGRRPVADLRLAAARRGARDPRPPSPPGHRHVAASRGVPLGATVRRLPRRDVGAREPRRAQPHAPRKPCRPEAARARRPHADRARARADVVDLRAGPSPAARARRLGLAEHVAAAAGRLSRRSRDRASSSSSRSSMARPSLRHRSSSRHDRRGRMTTCPNGAASRRPSDRAGPGRTADAGRHELRLPVRGAVRREDRGAVRRARRRCGQQSGKGVGERACALLHRLAGDHRADRSTPATPLHLEPVPRRRRGRRLGGRAGRASATSSVASSGRSRGASSRPITERDRRRGARARPPRARDPPCDSAPRYPAAPPRPTRRVDSADGSGSPPGCASGRVPRPAG